MPVSEYSTQDKSRHYKQLGLEPGAAIRDVEAAYWKFARELRGQAAMASYNAAYEALVSKPQRTPAPDVMQPESAVSPATQDPPPETRPSKFNWQA
jgi:hypothetical protein